VEDDVDKLLLTPHEAAQVLGIGRSKLYQLMRAGTIASVRIGSCRRIPATSLPDLIAQLQEDAYDGVCR
jgi:excisionase family DNA binding protein